MRITSLRLGWDTKQGHISKNKQQQKGIFKNERKKRKGGYVKIQTCPAYTHMYIMYINLPFNFSSYVSLLSVCLFNVFLPILNDCPLNALYTTAEDKSDPI